VPGEFGVVFQLKICPNRLTADNIVPVGVISPDHVVTPAPIVDYIITNPV
jgi:hypothetical protein